MSNLAEKLESNYLPEPPLQDFTFSSGELRIFRQKERMDCAQWSEEYRILQVSSIPGLWRHANAPYFKEAMEIYSLPWVRELIVAAASQIGKTEFEYNTLGYDADYDPGPTLFVMPSKDTVQRVSLDRIQPMFDDCAPLRALKSKNPDDMTTARIKLNNGMFIYMGWAGSDAILASTPVKHVKIDEADLVGRRAINLARARFRTFSFEYKLLEVSKPSTEEGPIWEDLNSCHIIFDFHVPCPHCGHEQTMHFGQFRWTDGVTDPKRIETTKDAWYECESCAGRWDESLRNFAAQQGRLKPRHFCAVCYDTQLIDGVCPRCGCEEAADLPEYPEKVGLHLPAFYSRFVSFYSIVADYLRMQQDPTGENQEKFWCDDCALPIPADPEGEITNEKTLYDRREEYAPKGALWRIPMGACLLTAAVDVQGNRLELEIEAWGPGRENWGIEYHVISGSPSLDATWKELESYLERTWLHESGLALRITAMGIDTGGHHTSEAYAFCKKWKRRRVYALKGSHVPGKPIKNKPSTKNKAKVPLYTVGTEAAKDSLFGWFSVDQPGPRYQHFPTVYGFEFFRQLCSEAPRWKKDPRGRMVKVYELRKGYVRNEGLDLRVYSLAVLEILNPNLDKLAADLRAQAEELEDDPKALVVQVVRGKAKKMIEALPEEERAAAEERVNEALSAAAPLVRKKKKVVKKRKTGFASRVKG